MDSLQIADQQWQREAFTVSTSRQQLDLAWIHIQLAEKSYWAKRWKNRVKSWTIFYCKNPWSLRKALWMRQKRAIRFASRLCAKLAS